MKKPETAVEALEAWMDGKADASLVCEFAESEGVSLETLVPDEAVRKRLIHEAEDFGYSIDDD